MILCALFLALFEGPAEVLFLFAILVLALSGGFKNARLFSVEVALLCWIGFGLFGKGDGQISLFGETSLRPLLALGFVVGCYGVSSADPKTQKRIAAAFVIGCAINAFYGVFQVFAFDPPLEELIIRRVRSEHLKNPADPDQLRMATGLFYNRMKLAHVGIIGLLLALLSMTLAEKKTSKWWSIAALVVISVGVLLTYRRAAPVALIVALCFLAILIGRTSLALTIALVGLIVLGGLVLSTAGEVRAQAAGDDFKERVEIYRTVLSLAADHPIFGVGHGDYSAAIARYIPEGTNPDLQKNLLSSPHNMFLLVLAETGILGLLAFSLAVFSVLVRLIFRVRASREKTDQDVVIDRFALCALLIILFLGVFHEVLRHAPVALLFWSLLGLSAARLRRAQ